MFSRMYSRSSRSASPAAAGGRGASGLLWRFVRRHWFKLALVLLVLLALWRRRPSSQPAELVPMTPPKETPERFTQRLHTAPQSASLADALAEPVAAAGIQLPAIDDATTVAFLQRFARTAVAEQERFGMPASVLLASAYINSFAGKRNCATEANNYVALRCTADWPGAVITLDGVCYRRYNTAWESLRDFNAYYSRKDWYAELKKNAGRNWKKWLKGLAAQGVSDVANFEVEAARIIMAFRVHELDEPGAMK